MRIDPDELFLGIGVILFGVGELSGGNIDTYCRYSGREQMDQCSGSASEIEVPGHAADFFDNPAKLVVVPLALNAAIPLEDLVVKPDRDGVVGIGHGVQRLSRNRPKSVSGVGET